MGAQRSEWTDRQEIHDVVLRYCRGIDRLDFGLVRSAYHPDAVDHHTGFDGSVEEYLAWVEPRLRARARTGGTMHILGNHLVELHGDEAVSETYGTSVHWGEPAHSARANFTVVAICNASAPYCIPAPTTELVSWIASAAHRPNCVCDKPNVCPSTGNRKMAIALSKNTVTIATVTSGAFARMATAAAAMALPPQIAVPTETSSEASRSVLNAFPSNVPMVNVAVIPMAV